MSGSGVGGLWTDHLNLTAVTMQKTGAESFQLTLSGQSTATNDQTQVTETSADSFVTSSHGGQSFQLTATSLTVTGALAQSEYRLQKTGAEDYAGRRDHDRTETAPGYSSTTSHDTLTLSTAGAAAFTVNAARRSAWAGGSATTVAPASAEARAFLGAARIEAAGNYDLSEVTASRTGTELYTAAERLTTQAGNNSTTTVDA